MAKDLVVFQTHVEFYMDDTGLSYAYPVFIIFGSTITGEPVQVLVRNFYPYIYIESANGKEYKENDIMESIKKLDIKGMILDVEVVFKQNIFGYSDSKSRFYKLTFSTPHVFAGVKALLEEGVVVKRERVVFKVYESNIPFVIRFMCDLGMVGMSYAKIKKYEVVHAKPLTVTASYESIECLAPEGSYVKLPPLKILSIDIECVGSNGFPSSKVDPIIQIGNTVSLYGSKDQVMQDIFCLKETTGIPGANVHWHETEKELLEGWRKYFMDLDPDIIIGYNIKGFDIPYILDRGEAVGIEGFSCLGRLDKKVKVRDTTMSGNMFGSIMTTEVDIGGRLVIDMMLVIRRDFKLRSYSLNSVSIHFLKEQKEDVPYSSIGVLQAGDKDSRRRIASYCLRDTLLTLRLFNKLSVLVNYTELSRVTGVPIEYFFSRGISIKMFSLIYRMASREGYVVPVIESFELNRGFEGGFVMDPIRGFYDKPVSVMDFSSLYPSIMISKNLCYTTLLTKEQYGRVGGVETPTGDYFCSAETKKGLLPRILTDLLASRRAIRKAMEEENDEELKVCLNGRQLAMKLCANSIYGFTGASTGKLPCFEISQSVTGLGGKILSTFESVDESCYGTCKSVKNVEIGGERAIRFEGVRNGASTIVLFGSSKEMLDEAERSIHDALCVLMRIKEDPRAVYGGGASEMSMAVGLNGYAMEVAGAESDAILSFSNALQQIPKILAENGGHDGEETKTSLRAEHSSGNSSYGVNVKDGSVCCMKEIGIIDSFRIKKRIIMAASEVAQMIVKCDGIAKRKPRERTRE